MSKYKLSLLKEADEDLAFFKKNDRKSYIKCFDLLRDIANTPRKGIGKPERLRHFEDNEVYRIRYV